MKRPIFGCVLFAMTLLCSWSSADGLNGYAHIVGADCQLQKTGTRAGMQASFTSFVVSIVEGGGANITVYRGPRNSVDPKVSKIGSGVGYAHRLDGFPMENHEAVVIQLDSDLAFFFNRPTLVLSKKVLNANDDVPTASNFLSNAKTDDVDIALSCFHVLDSTQEDMGQLPLGTERFQHPSICSIQHLNPSQGAREWTHGCTGAVVGPRTVLTAAHCQKNLAKSERTRVFCGEANKALQISKWTANPAYDVKENTSLESYPGDVSVIELDSDVGAPALGVERDAQVIQSRILEEKGVDCFHYGMGSRQGGLGGILYRAPYSYPDEGLGGRDLVRHLLEKKNLLSSDPVRFLRRGDSGGPVVCNIRGKETIVAVQAYVQISRAETVSVLTSASWDFISPLLSGLAK